MGVWGRVCLCGSFISWAPLAACRFGAARMSCRAVAYDWGFNAALRLSAGVAFEFFLANVSISLRRLPSNSKGGESRSSHGAMARDQIMQALVRLGETEEWPAARLTGALN